MAARDKWMPQHWRSGCWVEAYTRKDGVRVKRHWRSGGPVRGHYSDMPRIRPGALMGHETAQRTTTPKATLVSAEGGAEMATLARALERLGTWRVTRTKARHRGAAMLTEVRWQTQNGETGRWPADAPANPGQWATQLTVVINMREDGQLVPTRYVVDTDLMVLPDGTAFMTQAAQGHTDQIIRAMERFADSSQDEASRTRARNRVRERLQEQNPEKAVADALREIIQITEPPTLNITKSITMPAGGGRYVVTIAPMPV